MWINWIVLAFLGLAFGLSISAGLFAFLIGLGRILLTGLTRENMLPYMKILL